MIEKIITYYCKSKYNKIDFQQNRFSTKGIQITKVTRPSEKRKKKKSLHNVFFLSITETYTSQRITKLIIRKIKFNRKENHLILKKKKKCNKIDFEQKEIQIIKVTWSSEKKKKKVCIQHFFFYHITETYPFQTITKLIITEN